MPFNSVLELIGNTPLVKVNRIDTGCCSLFLKLENRNPGDSIKDRIAVSMIEEAERTGKIKAGGTIIEATAGNTGIGLALIGALKGYHVKLVVPDKMSREKVNHLRALGAEVVITRSDVGKGHPQYYQDLAASIAMEIPNSYYINQFSNPANPLAHEETTGPEIWEGMDHKVDAVVCGVGSSGTLSGLSRYFAKTAPNVEIVLADPDGSVLVEYVRKGTLPTPGSWLVEGIGEDFIPDICDLSRVKTAYTITDRESFEAARDLARKEGIFAGSSTGTLVAAALRYCREQTTPKRVVTFACDSGNKYLSKMYNDYWMMDQGFIKSQEFGDLRDLITRRFDQGGVVSLTPDDPLLVANARMRLYDISQLPVLEGDRIVGIIDESDILAAAYQDNRAFKEPVKSYMTANVIVLKPAGEISKVVELLKDGYVPVVCEGDHFFGMITRTDFMNFLRRKAV